MALRCGCENEGDEIVFGRWHVPSIPERTATSGEPLPALPWCAYPPDAVALQTELDRIESRYLTTLSDGDGDLG